MSVQVRSVTAEELPAFFTTIGTSFLERREVDRVAQEVAPLWDLDRTLGAFVDGRLVGTFRSWPTEITVPGGARLPTAAVSAVSVLPTHRRRGILRTMTAVDHAADRERGEAMAVLHAAEYPIYGRFGYGVGTMQATWTLDTRTSAFVPSAIGRDGSVELVAPEDGTAGTLAAVYDAWRADHPGEIARPAYRWRFDLGLADPSWGERWKGWLVLHRDDAGIVDGYLRYTAEQKWEESQPRGIVSINELHAVTDDAYAALWRYCADLDWAVTVKAEGRGRGERLPWLLVNARGVHASDMTDGMWLRIFDIPRALSARSYEHDGRVVLEVIDAEAPDGRVRVKLDAHDGGGMCRVTDAAPDVTLDVSALSTAYLGGTPLSHAVLASGVDEHRAGALRTADRLLRTLDEPWCSTFF